MINYHLSIPVNFKQTVYETTSKYGTEDDWNFLYNKAIATTSNTEQVRMFRALANTKEFCLLKL